MIPYEKHGNLPHPQTLELDLAGVRRRRAGKTVITVMEGVEGLYLIDPRMVINPGKGRWSLALNDRL